MGPILNFIPYLIIKKKIPTSMEKIYGCTDVCIPVKGDEPDFVGYFFLLLVFLSTFLTIFFLIHKKTMKAKKSLIFLGICVSVIIFYYALGFGESDLFPSGVLTYLEGGLITSIFYLAGYLVLKIKLKSNINSGDKELEEKEESVVQ